MAESEFNYEFFSKVPDPNNKMRDLAETRLLDLTEGNTDLTGAAVSIEEVTHETTPNLFQARVVVYIRPEDIAAVEKDENPLTALKGALSAVERQVREKRKKLSQHWKQP
jgi:ribosome-associated translation inhibitor RaiA